jgi:hypothetical protein
LTWLSVENVNSAAAGAEYYVFGGDIEGCELKIQFLNSKINITPNYFYSLRRLENIAYYGVYRAGMFH